ncbi:MAG: hypothetical protein ACI4JM_07605, partial [Oscillospiraceae bacterium]
CPHTPVEFRRLRTATRALHLDPTSFLKKAGQKLLVSLLYLLILFFLLLDRKINIMLKTEGGNLPQKLGKNFWFRHFALLVHFLYYPTAWIRRTLKTRGGNLPQKA